MAENKNSFIAYVDWKSTFDMLSDTEAGQLIKHLFAYVNDENPITEDRFLKLAFEPIKNQLKRDLIKWGGGIEKKSIAGKLGNLKRWHLDLYNLVESKELKIEDAMVIAQNRTSSQSDKCNRTSSQSIGIIAVNEDVNVNVDVDVNEVKKKRKEKASTSVEAVPDFKEFLSHALTKEPDIDEKHLKAKYESWVEADWHTGKGEKIKRWKSTLTRTIPFIQVKKQNPLGVNKLIF